MIISQTLAPTEQKKELSDQELVEAIVKDGNMVAFGELYERFVKVVYNKCYSFFSDKEKAEDLTQDVFLKIYDKLPMFKQGSLIGWILTMAYNACVDKSRKESRYREVGLDRTDPLEAEESGVEEKMTFELKLERLRVLMDMIDPMDRSLLLLKYQQGLKVHEISELVDMGESAVKMRLSRARKELLRLHETTDWNE